ncbi:APE2, partial [Symbiodinium necroappetens]
DTSSKPEFLGSDAQVVLLLVALCFHRARLAFLQAEEQPVEGTSDTGNDLDLSSEREVLPAEVVPERYDLHLDLDPEHLDTFSGEVTMTLQVTSETPFITLNARALSIDMKSVAFRQQGSDAVQAPVDTAEDAELERVSFHFSENLPLGLATLQLSYTGQLGQDRVVLHSCNSKGQVPSSCYSFLGCFMCRVQEKDSFLLECMLRTLLSLLEFLCKCRFFHCTSLPPSVVGRQLKPNRPCYDLQTEQVDKRAQALLSLLRVFCDCAPPSHRLYLLPATVLQQPNIGFNKGNLGNSGVEASLHLPACTGTRSAVESWATPC